MKLQCKFSYFCEFLKIAVCFGKIQCLKKRQIYEVSKAFILVVVSCELCLTR
jgi:hypothetical protein